MGYRSDVRILVSKKGYDKLYKYVQNETEKNKLDYNLKAVEDKLYLSNKEKISIEEFINCFEIANISGGSLPLVYELIK